MEKIRYAFGPFVLDPSEYSLWRDGEFVEEIYPKEFDLLVLFIRDRNRLLTKDELLEKGWPGYFVEEETMAKSISRLRKVLGDDGETYIKLVPRRGYRWICPVRELRDLDSGGLVVRKCTQIGRAHAIPSLDIRMHLEWMARFYELTAANLRAVIRLLDDPTGPIAFEVLKMLTPEQRATFFFELAREADIQMMGAGQSTYLGALDGAGDNLRAALDFYNGQPGGAVRELEMAVSLAHFWEIRRRGHEGRALLERALSRHPGDSLLKAQALAWLGEIEASQNQYTDAKAVLLESVRISRAIEDKKCLGLALRKLATIAKVQRRYSQAKMYLNESLQAAEAVDDGWLVGWCLEGLGGIARAEEDCGAAIMYHERHLAKAQEIGDTRGIAAAYAHLGSLTMQQGDYGRAIAHQEKSLAFRGGIQHKWGIADCHLNLGMVEDAKARHRQARHFFSQSLAIYQEMGERYGIARTLEASAKNQYALGNEQQAGQMFAEASAIRSAISSPQSLADRKSYGQIIESLKKKFPAQWKEDRRQSLDA